MAQSISILLLTLMLIGTLWTYRSSSKDTLLDHDSRLIEHDDRMSAALEHIYADVIEAKKIALDTNHKLDIILSIATNANVHSSLHE